MATKLRTNRRMLSVNLFAFKLASVVINHNVQSTYVHYSSSKYVEITCLVAVIMDRYFCCFLQLLRKYLYAFKLAINHNVQSTTYTIVVVSEITCLVAVIMRASCSSLGKCFQAL